MAWHVIVRTSNGHSDGALDLAFCYEAANERYLIAAPHGDDCME